MDKDTSQPFISQNGLPKWPSIQVKFPVNLQGLSWKETNLLSVYLQLKSRSQSGLITKTDLRHYQYYKQKLIDRGLIIMDRSGKYRIRCYAAAWRIFGMKPTLSNHGRFRKVFCKRIELDDRKIIKEVLIQHRVTTLENQLKYAGNPRRAKASRIKIELPLPSSVVAKALGYRATITGWRMRKKHFKVINEPLLWCQRYVPSIDPYRRIWVYKTKRVSL